MKKELKESELKTVAEKVRDHVFIPSLSRKTTIFLCGADITDKTTGRYKMAQLLNEYRQYELLFPEDIFDDLMTGQGQYSLLDLENLLAESVDAIVILPESPGSLAELGAFANNEDLANRIICIGQQKYSKKKSFINYGPIRLIKNSRTGKVLNIRYDELDSPADKVKIYRRIRESLAQITLRNPIKKDVANIMETENFVLPCIYLIDLVSSPELIKLIEYATGHPKKICEIATRSSITRLINKHYIIRTPTGYSVTKLGIKRIRDRASERNLDLVRMEIINSQNRKKSMIKEIAI